MLAIAFFPTAGTSSLCHHLPALTLTHTHTPISSLTRSLGGARHAANVAHQRAVGAVDALVEAAGVAEKAARAVAAPEGRAAGGAVGALALWLAQLEAVVEEAAAALTWFGTLTAAGGGGGGVVTVLRKWTPQLVLGVANFFSS